MYRGREGQWAFFLHRISGVALALYLLLHVFDISLVMFGPDGPFNAFLFFYHQWPFRVGLVLIIAAVTYHALNGLRIILMDFTGWGSGTSAPCGTAYSAWSQSSASRCSSRSCPRSS